MKAFLDKTRFLMESMREIAKLNSDISDREFHLVNYKKRREELMVAVEDVKRELTQKILNDGVQSLWKD